MARSVSYPVNAIAVFEPFHGDEFEWQWFIEDLQRQLQSLYPSVEPCDEWLAREDHAIARNAHAYFGVSEYMGLVAIWVVERVSECNEWGEQIGFAANWVAQIEPGFKRAFGSLVKAGSCSNGEGVYRAKAGDSELEDCMDGPLIVGGALCHGVYAA